MTKMCTSNVQSGRPGPCPPTDYVKTKIDDRIGRNHIIGWECPREHKVDQPTIEVVSKGKAQILKAVPMNIIGWGDAGANARSLDVYEICTFRVDSVKYLNY